MKYLKKFANHNAYNVAKSGLLLSNVSTCVQEHDVHYNPYTWADDYFTIRSLEDDNVISFIADEDDLTIKTIFVSTDNGETWEEKTSSTDSGVVLAELNSGDMLLIKGNNTWYGYTDDAYGAHFGSTKDFEVMGNIMSLLYGDEFKDKTVLPAYPDDPDEEYSYSTFMHLFYNCSHLISAKNLVLPAETLNEFCYYYMFEGCASLKIAPELPATTLASQCYSNMFYGCTSLTTAPELPATTLATYCYSNMFNSCTSLTTAPELPVTTLASYCYGSMFYGCTSLTTAPELPATTLAGGCYEYMFYGCTSLTTAPELPATTLADHCYSYMFYGCTSLTSAPELPATTLARDCYDNMFQGCTSLNYIKAMFTTTPSTTYTSNWVQNVSSTGTFVKNSAATWNVTGVHGIPTGWTVETSN